MSTFWKGFKSISVEGLINDVNSGCRTCQQGHYNHRNKKSEAAIEMVTQLRHAVFSSSYPEEEADGDSVSVGEEDTEGDAEGDTEGDSVIYTLKDE